MLLPLNSITIDGVHVILLILCGICTLCLLFGLWRR